jgi:hypothetical protein
MRLVWRFARKGFGVKRGSPTNDRRRGAGAGFEVERSGRESALRFIEAQLQHTYALRRSLRSDSGQAPSAAGGRQLNAKRSKLRNEANYLECCVVWINLMDKLLATQVCHFDSWLRFVKLGLFWEVSRTRRHVLPPWKPEHR